jgi:hypothetical protein
MSNLKMMLPIARRMRPSIEFTMRYFAAFKTIYTAITAIIAKNKIVVSITINVKSNLTFIKYFGSSNLTAFYCWAHSTK